MHIIIDCREKSSGLQELLAAHFTIAVKKIPYGDYLINDRITVERKTARDFLISIIDLRLFKQAALSVAGLARCRSQISKQTVESF